MSQAENNASAGEIVVHESMRAVTDDIARYSSLGGGLWKLEALHEGINIQGEPKDIKSTPQATGRGQDVLAQDLLGEIDIIGGLKPFVPDELFIRMGKNHLRFFPRYSKLKSNFLAVKFLLKKILKPLFGLSPVQK